MIRHAPTTILLTVTPLLAGYGSASWSWLGGPVAALAVWALEHAVRGQPAASETAVPVRPTRRPASAVDV